MSSHYIQGWKVTLLSWAFMLLTFTFRSCGTLSTRMTMQAISYLIRDITMLKAVRIRQKLQRRCSSNCGVSTTSICSWCISPSLWHTLIRRTAILLNGGGTTRSRSTSVCNQFQLCATVMLICGIRKHAIPGDVGCHGRAGRRRTCKEYRHQVSICLLSRYSLTRSYQATLREAYLSTCSAMPALSPKFCRLNTTHT